MNKRVFEIEVDDDAEGISLVSMVDRPAIQSNFIKLSEDEKKLLLSSNQEKQYVTGAVLIPDQEIYRNDDKDGEYFIKFSADSIEKIRNKFFKTGELKMSNLDHNSTDTFEAYLIESWIVADPEKDKSVALGFTDVKAGALYATYHIPDINAWQEVSKRNGFSLEGKFNMKPVQLAEVDEFDVLLNNLIEAVSDSE